MNMNGMMFGGEGPVMAGTWYNPNTGDAFTVRDSFFEDNQYVVTTTDGRYLKYNQIQNYVQTDMKLEDLKKLKTENKKEEEVLPAEVASLIEEIDPNDPYNGMMSPDDLMIGTAKPVNLGNLGDDRRQEYVQVPGPSPRTQHPFDLVKSNQQSMNEAIIEKALKNAPKPEIKVDVNWDVYPEKQIEMLKDVMDISEDEIIMWYLDNIDMMELVDALKTAIKNRILCNNVEVIAPTTCCDPKFYVEVPTTITETEIKPKQKKTTRKKKTN